MNKVTIKKMANKLGFDIYRYDSQSFRTTYNRPKYSKNIVVTNPDYFFDRNVAIILQGALKKEDDFTAESIELYKRLYPTALIILSTWEDDDVNYIKKIETRGAKVIINKKPQNFGHGSINLQLKSTQSAIRFAQDSGCEYILKTRTDQRLYGEENITYLMQLLKDYPLDIKAEAKGRIITCSNGCFSGRLYNVSDMVIFGYTEDVLAYFSCPEDDRCNTNIEPGDDLILYSKKRPGEIYFATHYIEKLGFELQWTENDSLFFIKNLFIIVDNETLDWYWPKYTDSEYRWRDYSGRKLRQLTYKDWKKMQMTESGVQ